MLVTMLKSMIIMCLLSLNLFSAENCNCSITFYIRDSDTTGTNIRATPGGSILSRIPSAKETFHGIHAVEFRNGWWKIDYLLLEDQYKKTFLTGWIHNSVIGVDLDDGEFVVTKEGLSQCTTPIYNEPTYAAKSGVYMAGNSDEGKRVLTGCSGKWLKIKQVVNNDTINGWWAPEDRCSNPLTNCVNSRDGELKGVDEWGNK